MTIKGPERLRIFQIESVQIESSWLAHHSEKTLILVFITKYWQVLTRFMSLFSLCSPKLIGKSKMECFEKIVLFLGFLMSSGGIERDHCMQWIKQIFKEMITLYSPTPQNGQTHSSNSSATADELLECV